MNTYYFYGTQLSKLPNIVVISRTLTHGTEMMLDRLGITYTTCKKLQPDWSTMVGPYKEGRLTAEEYTKRYMVQLEKLDPHELVGELGLDAVLVCYEKPGEFCHRHIVATWLQSHDYDITEFSGRQKIPKKLDKNITL